MSTGWASDVAPKTHSTADVRKLAEGWTREQLTCRAAGAHAWLNEEWTYVRGHGYYRVDTPCARSCGAVRHFDQDAIGQRSPVWVDYPEGYLSDIGRLDWSDRAIVRDVHRSRVTIKTSLENTPPRFKGGYVKVTSKRRRAG
jgi:hypothetical protein